MKYIKIYKRVYDNSWLAGRSTGENHMDYLKPLTKRGRPRKVKPALPEKTYTISQLRELWKKSPYTSRHSKNFIDWLEKQDPVDDMANLREEWKELEKKFDKLIESWKR